MKHHDPYYLSISWATSVLYTFLWHQLSFRIQICDKASCLVSCMPFLKFIIIRLIVTKRFSVCTNFSLPAFGELSNSSISSGQFKLSSGCHCTVSICKFLPVQGMMHPPTHYTSIYCFYPHRFLKLCLKYFTISISFSFFCRFALLEVIFCCRIEEQASRLLISNLEPIWLFFLSWVLDTRWPTWCPPPTPPPPPAPPPSPLPCKDSWSASPWETKVQRHHARQWPPLGGSHGGNHIPV